MWAMMQKFRICAGAVKVLSAKLLIGFLLVEVGTDGAVCPCQGIEPQASRHNRARPSSPMLDVMPPQWKRFQRVAGTVTKNLVFNEAPKIIRQLQQSENRPRTVSQGIQQGLKLGLGAGLSVIAGAAANADTPAITAGRPVTSASVPTAHRARKIVYAPDLDGRADPGEIVWTWVVYEDDPTRGKDRPVLVVGRDRRTLLGLMLSSQDHHRDHPDWVGIGSGDWDYDGRASWVRLDRVLDVPEEGIRREGAILERERFEVVAAQLRARFSWS